MAKKTRGRCIIVNIVTIGGVMWRYKYEKTYENIEKKTIWELWSDIENWKKWNPGIKDSKLNGSFSEGSTFTLITLEGREVNLKLIEVVKEHKFVDCTQLPGAKMYGIHEIIPEKNGVRLVTIIKIEGILTFLWKRIIGNKIVQKIPQQTENLVELAKKT
ncbi:hypothetical protein QEJ31_14555 [Pigmentibacter sp. JX0631]|uniref:hypothetical protein n=1 Tax=Pigmentibacter sp. JX0631 TaxID=2976982 RepID=UPI002468F715|nr:hypothetical protein [Pigmentibacter sp. JX0631]WGL59751.1 hypothetical protein QEJ31_14555 [Pigmentibacter sp. JX0631]